MEVVFKKVLVRVGLSLKKLYCSLSTLIVITEHNGNSFLVCIMAFGLVGLGRSKVEFHPKHCVRCHPV